MVFDWLNKPVRYAICGCVMTVLLLGGVSVANHDNAHLTTPVDSLTLVPAYQSALRGLQTELSSERDETGMSILTVSIEPSMLLPKLKTTEQFYANLYDLKTGHRITSEGISSVTEPVEFLIPIGEQDQYQVVLTKEKLFHSDLTENIWSLKLASKVISASNVIG